jgi:NAD(P)-dependent dehydrogenase (short-subunit alcohol dehydrogenase family)
MKGKVVVITGATSGIGLIAAERLAAMGARIVLVARDMVRGEAALVRLRIAGPGVTHTIHYADLSSIADTKRVAAAIAAAEPRIDVLINNAGAVFGTRRETADGLEMTFATNHMAYWVMTHGLRERLVASAPARVVSTASAAHNGQSLDFDDLQAAKSYSAFKAYGRSKLCNILFTRALARRTAKTGVTANCLHPGFVATRFGDTSGGLLAIAIRIAKLFAISEDKGAETIVYLASSPEVATVSGGYFYKCRPIEPSAAARNDADGERLWDVTKKLAGVLG